MVIVEVLYRLQILSYRYCWRTLAKRLGNNIYSRAIGQITIQNRVKGIKFSLIKSSNFFRKFIQIVFGKLYIQLNKLPLSFHENPLGIVNNNLSYTLLLT